MAPDISCSCYLFIFLDLSRICLPPRSVAFQAFLFFCSLLFTCFFSFLVCLHVFSLLACLFFSVLYFRAGPPSFKGLLFFFALFLFFLSFFSVGFSLNLFVCFFLLLIAVFRCFLALAFPLFFSSLFFVWLILFWFDAELDRQIQGPEILRLRLRQCNGLLRHYRPGPPRPAPHQHLFSLLRLLLRILLHLSR